MRTQITVISVGEKELLSGGAPKLTFTASNGDGVEMGCFTFKPTVIDEVAPGAVLDVDIESLQYTTKQGPLTLYKVTWLYKPEEEKTKNQSAQSGTWKEEKAAEIIGQLLTGNIITTKHKLSKKLFKWLDETMLG